MKTMSFFLTSNLKERLDEIAKERYQSFSSLIKWIISNTEIPAMQITRLSLVHDGAETVSISADFETFDTVSQSSEFLHVAKSTILTSAVVEFLNERHDTP